MSQSGKERRQHIRIDATFLVSYRAAGSKEPFDLSQTVNFSCGGILLNATHAYAIGERLEIKIVLPKIREKFSLHGEVIDTTKVVEGLIYRTRIRFLDLTPEVDTLLKSNIEEYNTGA